MTPMPALPRPNLASGHISAPCYLLTGLMRCGVCGGGYTKISANLFGCAAARNKGTCDNRLNIRTDALEDIVCVGLKQRLMDPDILSRPIPGQTSGITLPLNHGLLPADHRFMPAIRRCDRFSCQK